MSWIELCLNASHEAIDWVSTLLASIDYSGDIRVAACDASASGDQENDRQPDWAFTLCLDLPNQAGAATQVKQIQDLLTPLIRTGLASEIEISTLAEKPIASDLPANRIGSRFVVVPADSTYAATTDEMVLKLDAGLSFGSGLHPATRLSLQCLEQQPLTDLNTLDLGSGSGILSVAMAKLGAQVLALDNDPIAVQATQEAAQRNHVEPQVTARAGSLGQGSSMGHWMGGSIDPVSTVEPAAAFDVITANILARVHIALAEDYRRALRHTATHTGLLITAGYTVDYEPEVNAALAAAGFEGIDRQHDHEWVALVHRLK